MFVPFFFIFLFFLSFTIPIIQQKKNLFFVRKLMLKKKSFQLVYYSNTIQPFFMQLFVGEIFDILTTASDTVQIYWYQNFDSKKKKKLNYQNFLYKKPQSYCLQIKKVGLFYWHFYALQLFDIKYIQIDLGGIPFFWNLTLISLLPFLLFLFFASTLFFLQHFLVFYTVFFVKFLPL